MSEPIKKFHDRAIRPPKGGWHYPLGGGIEQRHGENEIIEEMMRWRRNNRENAERGNAERDLWNYLCGREPGRCGLTASDVQKTASNLPAIPAEKTPALQGPAIWRFLNTLAAVWTPGLADYFLATLNTIPAILECPTCREEWRVVQRKYPPSGLNSRVAVCKYVNAIHNEVNVKIGKAIYPYSSMIREYGAPNP